VQEAERYRQSAPSGEAKGAGPGLGSTPPFWVHALCPLCSLAVPHCSCSPLGFGDGDGDAMGGGGGRGGGGIVGGGGFHPPGGAGEGGGRGGGGGPGGASTLFLLLITIITLMPTMPRVTATAAIIHSKTVNLLQPAYFLSGVTAFSHLGAC
jgi:hypothetical protein